MSFGDDDSIFVYEGVLEIDEEYRRNGNYLHASFELS